MHLAMALGLALAACDAPPGRSSIVRRVAWLGVDSDDALVGHWLAGTAWMGWLLEAAPGLELVVPQGRLHRSSAREQPDPDAWGSASVVDALLGGRLERRNERLRLTVVLSDATTGTVRARAVFEPARGEEPRVLQSVRAFLERALAVRVPMSLPTRDPAALDAFFQALGWLDRENPEKAMVHLERATRCDPRAGLAWIETGHAALDLGRSQIALHAHKQAVALAPHLGAAERAGLDLLSARLLDDEAALSAALVTLLRARPGSTRALLASGALALDRLRLEEAADRLGRLHRLRPAHRQGLLLLGSLLLEQGRAAQARTLLEGIPRVLPAEEPDLTDATALAIAASGDAASADRAAIRAADAGFEPARLLRAQLALLLGHPLRAEAHLAQVTRSPNREVGVAVFSSALGHCDQARRAAQELEALASQGREATRVAARVLRARIEVSCGQEAAGLALLAPLARAVPARRSSLHAVTLYGVLAARAHRDAEALAASQLLRESAALHGTQPTALLALVEAERELAAGHWQGALARLEGAPPASELTALLRTRALHAGGLFEDCHTEGTRWLVDAQWPGELGGLESVPLRWAIAAQCLEAAGKRAEAETVRRRARAGGP